MFGGKCTICGYSKYVGALDFHHLDPTTKSFGLANRGLTKSMKVLTEEAQKCVLLCANCHREVEAGIISIPSGATAARTTVNRQVLGSNPSWGVKGCRFESYQTSLYDIMT